jgi:PAS domain-containing protein
MATKRRHETIESQLGSKTLRSAIDLLTEAIFLINRSARIVLANNAAQTMTGLPEPLLLRKPIATILSLQLSPTRDTHQKDPTPNYGSRDSTGQRTLPVVLGHLCST